MKVYKVIALSVGGLGGRIFRSGDLVREDNFYEGRADKLVDAGFLKLIPKPNSKAEVLTPEDPKPEVPKLSYDQLKATLIKNNIDFDPNSSWEELNDLNASIVNPV